MGAPAEPGVGGCNGNRCGLAELLPLDLPDNLSDCEPHILNNSLNPIGIYILSNLSIKEGYPFID